MKLKKKSVLLWVFILVLALSLVFVGCSSDEPDEPAAPDNGDENGEADEGDGVDRSDWPANISLGTAGTGGVYFTYGAGWGNLIAEELDINVGIEQTGGPADNMTLVNMKANDLAMITMGIGYEGMMGLEGTNFEGDPHEDVRALFPMYSTFSQWWAHKDAGITNIYDLEGKSVGVGPTGGTPGTYHPLILELLGIDADVRWAALGDLVESHQDGMIDANSFSSGIPVAGVLTYEATVGSDDVVFFGIDGEARDKVIEAYPYWTPDIIPADTYDFLDEDVETINVFNWAIVHKDMPDSLVYAIVDVVMTNNPAMLDIHGAAAETLPENVGTNTFLPLHPGAYQWFEDNGYSVDPGAAPVD